MALKKISLLFVFCLVLAPGAFAGEDEPPSSPAADKRSEIAACVMGRIITIYEVENRVVMVKEKFPDEPQDILFHHIRAQIAERILIIETAKKYAMDVTDDDVVRFYTDREIDEKKSGTTWRRTGKNSSIGSTCGDAWDTTPA